MEFADPDGDLELWHSEMGLETKLYKLQQAAGIGALGLLVLDYARIGVG